MDYKRVLRLHFVNHLSGRKIAESCGDCSKTTGKDRTDPTERPWIPYGSCSYSHPEGDPESI